MATANNTLGTLLNEHDSGAHHRLARHWRLFGRWPKYLKIGATGPKTFRRGSNPRFKLSRRLESEIVYGQLRIKAAKRLGIQEVPVILCGAPVQVNKEKRNP